jgi:2,3-bisphosphoglycerate-independent phosphoglycerate mutase
MKYMVLIGDGMADRPLPELDGRTPLQAAFTPNMDRMARDGITGRVRTVPKGFSPGSDVANLTILGYDPRQYYSGRAPIEAASMGIKLQDDDVAYRCNLVTLKYNKDRTKAVMDDYSAGHITSEEASELIRAIDAQLGGGPMEFFPGVSYRHLMVWHKGIADVECTPPHDISGKEVTDYLPVGKGEAGVREIMMRAGGILDGHPVNRARVGNGKRPANAIWLWGQGRKLKIPLFKERFGVEGSLVSAVDLMRGLGVSAGFEILKVPGITGYIDTNYQGKAEAALESLNHNDIAYIHVEAPDEAGHMGKCTDKVKALEDFDRLVVGRVMQGMEGFDSYRILLLPDHATPLAIRTHTEEPVPFAIFGTDMKRRKEGAAFDEALATREDAVVFEEGHLLMEFFIKSR